jgi:hypothetical protein
MKQNKKYLPDYPRTPHVPYKANLGVNDVLASNEDAKIIMQSKKVEITEKIDGANCGMALINGEPVIRNHTHILNKAYSKNTPAKKQFASIFNWFYQNKKKFEILNEQGSFSVFGEWLVAQHGILYDALPEWFIAFDLYDYKAEQFIESISARKILQESGFELVPQLFYGEITNFEQIHQMTTGVSAFTSSLMEGVYLKLTTGDYISHRFKMVREDFVQGALWDTKALKKNSLR